MRIASIQVILNHSFLRGDYLKYIQVVKNSLELDRGHLLSD